MFRVFEKITRSRFSYSSRGIDGERMPVLSIPTQCRMLHSILSSMLLLSGGVTCLAQAQDMASLEVTTDSQRHELQRVIERRMVVIERIRTHMGDTKLPGGIRTIGRGWRLSDGRILTVTALTAELKRSLGDQLVLFSGKQRLTLSVIDEDQRLGLAIVRASEADGGPTPLTTAWVPPSKGSLWPGRGLFTLGPGVASRVSIDGVGEDAFGYFLTATGDYPVGTPFVDAKGQLLTLVGQRNIARPTTLYLLPPLSMQWAAIVRGSP